MPSDRPRKAKTSKLLVVDASILHAAGGEQATHPTPTRARDTLMAILQICHRVCETPELRDERRRHQSRYARLWFTKMLGKKKIVWLESHDCSAMMAEVTSYPMIGEPEKQAIAKDIHLIAAARAADKIVLSLDDRVAAYLRRICQNVATTTNTVAGDILWMNPVEDHAAAQDWLSEAIPARLNWRLGQPRPRASSKSGIRQ